MKPMLTKKEKLDCYYFVDGKKIIGVHSNISGDVSNIYGDVSNIYGDVSNIYGNVSNIYGNVSNISGDINECELEEGKKYNIEDLIK